MDRASAGLVVTGCLINRNQQRLPGRVERVRILFTDGALVTVDLTGAQHVEPAGFHALQWASGHAHGTGSPVSTRRPDPLPDHHACGPRPARDPSQGGGAFGQERTAAAQAHLQQQSTASTDTGWHHLGGQYFQLGGTAGKAEIDAHLRLTLPPGRSNLLAHTANQLLPITSTDRAPYTTDHPQVGAPAGLGADRVTEP